MCFTPQISMATALFEFTVAIYAYIKCGKHRLVKYAIFCLVLLGIYQISEYMICTSGNIQFWGITGFIAYTILPALGLDMAFIFVGKKINKLITYLPVALFTFMAISADQFIVTGTCSKFFVTIRNLLQYNYDNNLLSSSYLFYYFFYLTIGGIIIYTDLKKTSDKKRIATHKMVIANAVSVILPALIFIILLPTYRISFPSVYCHFSIIYAIVVFFVCRFDHFFDLGGEHK